MSGMPDNDQIRALVRIIMVDMLMNLGQRLKDGPKSNVNQGCATVFIPHCVSPQDLAQENTEKDCFDCDLHVQEGSFRWSYSNLNTSRRIMTNQEFVKAMFTGKNGQFQLTFTIRGDKAEIEKGLLLVDGYECVVDVAIEVPGAESIALVVTPFTLSHETINSDKHVAKVMGSTVVDVIKRDLISMIVEKFGHVQEGTPCTRR